MDCEGDGDVCAAAKMHRVSFSATAYNLTSTIYQNADDPVLIGMAEVLKRHLSNGFNPGDLLMALLEAAGYMWNPAGKKLWRRASPEDSIKWGACKKVNSRNVASKGRLTALSGVDENVTPPSQSQGGVCIAPGGMPLPCEEQQDEHIRPEAGTLCEGKGSGAGHCARRLMPVCWTEMPRVAALVQLVQQHDRQCVARLRQVDGGAKAHYSCHSMGLVNVVQFRCSANCSFMWSSAKPLPGKLQVAPTGAC